MRTIVTLVGMLVSGLLAAGPVAAMDCTKASTTVEKAICADPDLLAIDEAMAKAYGEVRKLSTAPERKMLLEAQRTWIAERESECVGEVEAIKACIRNQMDFRLARFLGKPDSGPGNGNRIIPVYVIQDGSAHAYHLDVDFMRFATARTAGEKRFNAWIRDIADKLPVGRQQFDNDQNDYEVIAVISMSYLSPRLLSAHALYEYYDGGAHPAHVGDNINIDLTTGKDVRIEDFISETAAAVLVDKCYEQIAAEKKERLDQPDYDPAADGDLKRDVIAEHVATMKRWSITEDEVDLQFTEYAVGSYAEGIYGCTFPMTEFKGMARPGAPLP